MDPFASPPLPGSGREVSNDVMMDQVKQQLAQAYAEEFFGELLRVSGSDDSLSLPYLMKVLVSYFEKSTRLLGTNASPSV